MTGLVQFVRAINPSALCLALGAIALGHTLQIGNGFYHPESLPWLTASVLLAIAGAVFHRLRTEWSRTGATLICSVLTLGIFWQLHDLLGVLPGLYIDANMTLFKAAVWLQGFAVVMGLVAIQSVRRFWFPTLLAVSLFLGVWTIHASPNPYIDVVTVHKEAINALIDRQDPYLITFENIYEEALAKQFYSPGAVAGDRLTFAYPYPPPSLLLAVPGHVLFGDYRYSEVAMLVLAAALIGYARRGLTGKLAAALLLTTPRVWFVIEQGWTEPIAIFLLALTVFLLIRSSVPAALMAGIFVVTKQYLGFTGLAVVRLVFMRMRTWRWSALAGVAAAAAVILPFLLWHPSAFMRNVVWLQTLEPFRADSLSYLSWAARHGYGNGSYLWAVGAAVGGAIIATVTTRNTPSGFATAVAMTTFLMFVFGSKAFCNYYFFVIGALCCAIAAWPGRGEEDVIGVA